MAITIANWDEELFASEVMHAFQETGKIADNAYIRTMGNAAGLTYGGLAATTVTNIADNTEMTDAGNTEAGPTVTADNPLKSWVMIPLSAISTHRNPVVSEYSRQIGADLRNGFEKRFVNLISKNAATQVNFDDDQTGANLVAEIENAIISVAQNFDDNAVPTEGREVLITPAYFNLLGKSAIARSLDYVSEGDNTRPFNELNFYGMRVRSAKLTFNVNTASDTSYDTKYRVNNTSLGSPAGKVQGIAWHRSAVAWNWYEPLTIDTDIITVKDSLFVRGRMLTGSVLSRTSAGSTQIIVGD